jgi:hypothetical protein
LKKFGFAICCRIAVALLEDAVTLDEDVVAIELARDERLEETEEPEPPQAVIKQTQISNEMNRIAIIKFPITGCCVKPHG